MRSRAELYDWELLHVLDRTDQDVSFWMTQASAAGGSVLELACGTGRVAGPLVQAGLDVVGLDIDPEMLAAAKVRGVRQLVCGDMTRFALAAHFGLVLIAYNSLQLLTHETDRLACLRTALDHVAPGGLLGLEITDFQDGDVDDWVAPEHLGSHDGVTLHGSLRHDTTARITRYARRFVADDEVYEDELALWSPQPGHMAAVLEAAGAGTVRVVGEGPSQRWLASRP